MDRCQDASFAVADAMKAVIEAISLKRGLEELFRGANIRVKHRMADDLESWHLCYTIQGRNARYEMEEFKYRPERPLEGLNRYLLTTEAGEFRGCHDPSKERLQARRKLYGFRLRSLASLLLVFLLFLMALGKVTILPVLILVALGVTALVVVDVFCRVRIWIRKRRGEAVKTAFVFRCMPPAVQAATPKPSICPFCPHDYPLGYRLIQIGYSTLAVASLPIIDIPGILAVI